MYEFTKTNSFSVCYSRHRSKNDSYYKIYTAGDIGLDDRACDIHSIDLTEEKDTSVA